MIIDPTIATNQKKVSLNRKRNTRNDKTNGCDSHSYYNMSGYNKRTTCYGRHSGHKKVLLRDAQERANLKKQQTDIFRKGFVWSHWVGAGEE